MEVEQVRDEVLTHLESLRQEMRRGFDGIARRYDTDASRVGALEKHQAADFVRIQEIERRTGRLETARTDALENVLTMLTNLTTRVQTMETTMPDVPQRSRREQAVVLSIGGGLGFIGTKVIELIARAMGQ